MPTFFTDRDLGPHHYSEVVTILREAGLDVESHAEHFDPTTPDHEWLEHCGEKDWVPLTRDKRIRYTDLAKRKIMESEVQLFVLIGEHPFQDLAHNFVNSIDSIRNFLDNNPDPFIARLYKPSEEKFQKGHSGIIRKWLGYDEWLEEQD